MISRAMIRNETSADIPAIHDVTVAAFATLEISEHTEQFIIAALRAAGALAVSLVAERDGRVVGHIAFSPVSISDGARDWYGLGPLSVLPEYQRQGIGTALVEAGLARLKTLGARGCCLVGHPTYYRRFGFDKLPGLVYEGVPPEVFLALSTAGRRKARSPSTRPSALAATRRGGADAAATAEYVIGGEITMRIKRAYAALLAAMPAIVMADGFSIEGTHWSDDRNHYSYEFLPNNGFRYAERQLVNVEHRHTVPVLPMVGWTRSTQFADRVAHAGAWESGTEICGTGDRKGNLALYVDSMECCLSARLIGETLVLREVQRSGSGLGVCEGRTLARRLAADGSE